jgi:hypothetical protein
MSRYCWPLVISLLLAACGSASLAPCERSNVTVVLSATATTLEVGEKVTITLTVSNLGCALVERPSFFLQGQSGQGQKLVEEAPGTAEILDLPDSVAVGESGAVQFVYRAAEPGSVFLKGSVKYRVHLAGSQETSLESFSEPLWITVCP